MNYIEVKVDTTEIKTLLEAQKKELIEIMMQIMAPGQKKLSRREAAEFLGYKYDTMRNISKEKLPYEKVGKLFHYDMRDLQEYKMRISNQTKY
jgi:hypothetical protein